jgi:beta-glucanase (GH16 family)
MKRRCLNFLLLVGNKALRIFILLFFLSITCSSSAGSPSKGVQSDCSQDFIDNLDFFDENFWDQSRGTNDPEVWLNSWRPDHLSFKSGLLDIRLDDHPCSLDRGLCNNQGYASGEYGTLCKEYGPGRFQARLKAAKGSGLVTAFFIYHGTRDGTPLSEIDIEIFGKDPSQMHVTYWIEGQSYSNTVDLRDVLDDPSFDASAAFHDYTIDWSLQDIEWYVDGRLVHQENGTRSRGHLPLQPGKIYVSLWAYNEQGLLKNPWAKVLMNAVSFLVGRERAEPLRAWMESQHQWAGEFESPGEPVHAYFDWIRYRQYY